MFGFTSKIKHLDGRYIYFKTDQQNKFSSVKVIVGEGFKDLQGNSGNMFIHIETVYPDINILDENEQNDLKNLLVQMNLKDYQEEGKTIKEGNNNIKTLKQVHQEQRSSHHDQEGPPGCVQQ